MKVCGTKMEITLLVGNRERTFSEQELISILEKYFSSEETTEVAKTEQESKTYELADTPTEGKVFKVTPKAINKKLFQEKREDSRQEKTRKYILEALEKVKKNPKKYAEEFETLMPENIGKVKTSEEFEKEAVRRGGYVGDLVEQALEWAQRISNGESWEKVCNDPDTANWYRLVKGKNGEFIRVGGSRKVILINYPASEVHSIRYPSSERLSAVVPFVVLRKKK